ncbi:MAG: helix-turn-helix domain-containing protein [Candidatus Liptonbacteria bacterium]|nr:helix-turn-helix domain-containing protein [Candidatus Liptonbacteria bacterium]
MNDFLSTIEVSKILKVSRIAVQKKIKKGQIKAMKVGRNYVVPKEEVLKALGEVIGEESKKEIDKAIQKAVREYGEAFKKLGRE